MTRTASDIVAAHRAAQPAPAAGVDLLETAHDGPATRAGATQAHRARGTHRPLSDEGVAAFLAATAR